MSGSSDGGHTLAIEASTYAGSVAVILGSDVLVEREVEMRGREEERLMPAVAECVAALPGGLSAIARVVCGAGPGSFTSLRIAASIAKGICHARGLPLFAVSSLALIVAGSPAAARPGRYMATLDAMRGEAFTALFDVTADGGIVPAGGPGIVARAEVAVEATRSGAVLVEGAPKAGSVVRTLAAVIRGEPADLASWEPDYGRAAEAQVKWEAAHGRPLPR